MKILMVCLGNICRSPLAEGVLREKINRRGINGITIDSAGTSSYHVGDNPDERSVENAKNHGVDIGELKGRQFHVSDFDHFDKIYVMDTNNFNDVLFIARNSEDKMKVEMILNVIYPGTNMSVPDPYLGGEQGFENVYLLLEQACEIIADSLEKHIKQLD